MTRLHSAVFAAFMSFAAASSAMAADDQAQPAASAAPAAPAAAPAPPKPNRDEQMVCKTITPTGSRLGGKTTCMKRREWDQMAAEARDNQNHANPIFQPPTH